MGYGLFMKSSKSLSTSRYSAMMFTDIVGYSSMVGKDEKRALKLLAEHDDIIEPIIEKHKGTIIRLFKFHPMIYFHLIS